jgi:hypothetical protein
MCKFTGKIKQIIPFKGEIKKIDSFVGEFIKNYKTPVYDNELPIEWNTVAVANAGNAEYGNPRVKISSLALTIEELSSMKLFLSYPYSDGSGEALYELVCTDTDTSPDGYDVATFEDATTNRKAYFTIVPKGEAIPSGLYWAHNNYSANEVTESGWNYSLYLPVAYDDEFPLEWNSLEVSKLANAKDGNWVKISNLTPTSEEMESIVLTIGNETFTFSDSVVTNLGMRYFYESGDNKFIVDVYTNLVGAFPPSETGIYVEDVYYLYGTNVDCTASIVEQPDIPDTPTQYLYGHEAEATVSYNGVVLPDIESVWDKETKPKAIISEVMANLYQAALFNGEVCYNGAFIVANGQFSAAVYMLATTEENATMFGIQVGEWTLMVEDAIPDGENLIADALWTSHDILNTDGSVYLAASEPVHSYSDPDVIIDGVGYKGAVLPALPEWDYQYATIYESASFGYIAKFMSAPYVAVDNTLRILPVETYPNYSYKSYRIVDGEWVNHIHGTDVENSGGNISSLSSTIWANYDILYEDGTVALSATDPIPVYE